MTPLAVRVTVPAREQVFEQVQFIARHSVRNAVAWEARVRHAMDGLGDHPSHPTDHAATRRLGQPVCKWVFERTYLIFYRVDHAAGRIDVIWFRHGARQPGVGEP